MLPVDCSLTQRFKEKKSPIVYEEVKLLSDNQDEDGPRAKEIIARMDYLSANILIPMMRENTLIGFIVLGSRKQKEMYSADMIDILSVVGNEVALAVENAIFYEESGKDWTQRAHDSRTANSPGLFDLPQNPVDDNPDVRPVRYLPLFFQSLKVPDKAYQAENPEGLQQAIADIDLIKRLPLKHTKLLPRKNIDKLRYAIALTCVGILIFGKWIEVRADHDSDRPGPHMCWAGT